MTKEQWDFLPKPRKIEYWQHRLRIVEACSQVWLEAPELLADDPGGGRGIILQAKGEKDSRGIPAWQQEQGKLAEIQKRALDEMAASIKQQITEIEASE